MPSPEPKAPPPLRPWQQLLLALATAWVLARAGLGLLSTARGLGTAVGDARAALDRPADERIARATGITPAFVAALRAATAKGGTLWLFQPEPTLRPFLLLLFEQLKNLLYPEPRAVHYADSLAAMQAQVRKANEGRLLVLDGRQEAAELPLVAEFDLLGEFALGAARLRLWRLRKVP